jgi:hypothetical protein
MSTKAQNWSLELTSCQRLQTQEAMARALKSGRFRKITVSRSELKTRSNIQVPGVGAGNFNGDMDSPVGK